MTEVRKFYKDKGGTRRQTMPGMHKDLIGRRLESFTGSKEVAVVKEVEEVA